MNLAAICCAVINKPITMEPPVKSDRVYIRNVSIRTTINECLKTNITDVFKHLLLGRKLYS